MAGALALVAAVCFALGPCSSNEGPCRPPRRRATPLPGRDPARARLAGGGALQAVGWVVQAAALDRGAWWWCSRCARSAWCSPCPWASVHRPARGSPLDPRRRRTVVGIMLFVARGSPRAASRTRPPALVRGRLVTSPPWSGWRWWLAGDAALAAACWPGGRVRLRLPGRGDQGVRGSVGSRPAAVLTSWTTYALILSAVAGSPSSSRRSRPASWRRPWPPATPPPWPSACCWG